MKLDVKGEIVATDDAWVYDWFDLEHTSPADVHKALDEANGEDIDVEINSGGGNVFAGSEIYSALRSYPGHVNIHVTGLAASAASVIACAGHSDISPTAQMMVHNVSAQATGNYRDMAAMKKVLQQADRSIAAAYVEKSGMSEKDALDLMDAETWLTAQDAVDYGLIDEIAKPQNAEDDDDLQLTASVGSTLPLSVIQKMQARRQELITFFFFSKGE